MASRLTNVLVAERGATRDSAERGVLIAQRQNESSREFSQRVALELSRLRATGAVFPTARLRLSHKRGSAADARRFSLARVLLASLTDSEELSIGGPLADSDAGRLDIDALTETLLLVGSRAAVRAAHRDYTPGRDGGARHSHAA